MSHAWIRKRDIKPYTGSVQPGISVKLSDKKLKLAIEFAEQALDIELEGRFKLIGDLNIYDYESKNADEVSLEEIEDNHSPINKFVNTSKRKNNISNDIVTDEETSTKSIQRKRFKRILIDSEEENSDKEEEYKPSLNEEESDDETFSEANSEDLESSSENLDDDLSEDKIEQTKKPSKVSSKKSRNVSLLSNTLKSMSTSLISSVNTTQTHDEATDREWPHLSYAFLQPEKISDLKNRKMLINGELNTDYDPGTLYVPSEFLNKQTPAMRQWWEFKAANFDTILFFKMGKFYEVFHMDAVVATKELQILFMRGENAHAGFPEKSYKRYADALIQKGYKVARIEQTETPEMMEKRVKASRCTTKFDKVVKREICRISSLGTRYMSDIDSDALPYSNSYLFSFSHRVSIILFLFD